MAHGLLRVCTRNKNTSFLLQYALKKYTICPNVLSLKNKLEYSDSSIKLRSNINLQKKPVTRDVNTHTPHTHTTHTHRERERETRTHTHTRARARAHIYSSLASKNSTHYGNIVCRLLNRGKIVYPHNTRAN